MNELANTQNTMPAPLDNLARQARSFVQGACMNLLQLGRVLTEAKPLLRHGEFEAWVRENAQISLRTAEQYMQCYAEFGLDTRIAELGPTKVFKLLPMSEEEREKLLSENDVANMSTRQLDAAIRARKEEMLREARAEAKAEYEAVLEVEHSARMDAERRAREAEERPPEIPEELTDQLRQQRSEIERLADIGRDSVAEQRRLIQENNSLKRDLKERDEDLEAMQQACSRAQSELLNLQSQIARGDAEREVSDALTLSAFASAVRQFIGACARMPYMQSSFAAMTTREKGEYNALLSSVEGWARDSRRAMDAVAYDGAVIMDE